MILNEFFNLPQVFEKDMKEGTSNIGSAIKSLYQKIYDAGDDEVEYFYNDSPIFAQYWDEYEGDLDSIIAEVDPRELEIMHDELKSYVQDANLEEGIFGSRPSPVLPVVDKIAKVASGLTPQNVEVGKQIIQNKASEITRMLSPQTKSGVDVIEQGVAEGIETIFGREYAVDPNKYYVWAWDGAAVIYGEYDNIKDAKINLPKIEKSAIERLGSFVKGRFELSTGKELLQRYGKKEINELKQGVAEGKDDYVPPKEADYGPEYQAMVRRVGQKARAQEKAKQQQQPPKTPVRESRRELLKHIIQS